MDDRRNFHRHLAVLMLTVLVVTALASPAAAQDATEGDLQTDNTLVRVEVHTNGTAEWVLQTRTRLETQDDVAAFEQFQQDYQNNSDEALASFRTRMSSVVAAAGESTGREMTATNFTTTATVQEVPQQWGVVTFQFTWTEFAASDEGRIAVGDVFDGGWFLSDEDTLEINAPDGYTITSTEPTPTSSEAGTAIWTGRMDFADDNPRVVFTPDSSTKTPPTENDGLGLHIIGGALAVLVGCGGLVLWWKQRRAGEDESSDKAKSTMKTDEERIIDLLEARGGRMKQADINAEFDWSKSKTSLILSDMAEKGLIKKTRLGRENLVSLPD